MLAPVKILMATVSSALRRFSMLSSAYGRHGVVLPAGALLKDARSMTIGPRFGLSEGCMLFCQDAERGSQLEIGADVGLNVGVMINADCGGRIVIGDRVLIGPYTVIRAANHRIDDAGAPILEQGHKSGTIVIEDDVWLGAHVTVLPDVRIGRGAVIGAGSVVSRDVPALAIAAGAPAVVLRYRAQK
jgi:galactoside O-acetyltransferase